MGWSMVRMSDADISKNEAFRLQDEFMSIFKVALAPKDAAMFENLYPTKDNYLFYFSPLATEIFATFLLKYSATECQAPDRDSVALLVGHDDARERMLRPSGKTS